jgi:hypothetical protein
MGLGERLCNGEHPLIRQSPLNAYTPFFSALLVYT